MTSSAKMIDLTIKTLDSQNHHICIPDSFTILELKEFIEAKVNVEVDQQRLIFCGRVLSNETKLADIGVDGKVMHLVENAPCLSTTTSGSSSSTTTNTSSSSGQNAGPGLGGSFPQGARVVFRAIGIPAGLIRALEYPGRVSTRNNGTWNESSALDMIRRGNEILNRLEHSQTNPPQSSASNAEQRPDWSQEAEALLTSVPPEDIGAPYSSASESSVPQSQTDPDSVNALDRDETFPNNVVVTVDETQNMRLPPALMRQINNHLQGNHLFPFRQNSTETFLGSTNQSSAERASGSLPSSVSFEQLLRNDLETSENRSTVAVNYRQKFRELIEELNKLNERFRPFYATYCQLIIDDDSQFDTTEGEHESLKAQSIFDGVSEVMYFISHAYRIISEMKIAFNRTTPSPFQSLSYLQRSSILHSAYSVPITFTTPSTQQPTSTQTTTTSQSIPSVRDLRLNYIGGSETPNVSTSATETNTNTNMSLDPNTEINNTSTEFPSPTETPQGVELKFGLVPESVDSVEAAFINPTAPATTSLPAAVSEPQQPSVVIADPAMPIDWMDQMIDEISSGMQRIFISEQSLDSNSIPTTSTQTPCVTPRTTDSSLTTNPPSQGLAHGLGSTPHIDPCSSHRVEPNIRPVLRAIRSAQRTNNSTTSAASDNLTTDTSSPNSPNEVRSLTS